MDRFRWRFAFFSFVVIGAALFAALSPSPSLEVKALVAGEEPVRSELRERSPHDRLDDLARPVMPESHSSSDVRRVAGALAESGVTDATATLQILVLDQFARPIGGVALDLEVPSAPNPETRYLQPHQTDALGRARFSVPSGAVISVEPWITATRYFAEVGPTVIGPLIAGSTHDIELRVEMPSGWFHVLVLDDQDRPLPGVELHPRRFADVRPAERLWDDAQALTSTDTDGRALVPLETWCGGSVLATKSGYSPHVFAIDAEHGDPSRPFVLRVRPAGTVEVTILGERPVGGKLRVVLIAAWNQLMSGDFALWTESNASWSRPVDDANPITRIERLPADVFYSAALYDGAKLLAAEPSRFLLRPFEKKQLEFRLGVGATVVVRAASPEGAPTEDLQLNLYPGLHPPSTTQLRQTEPVQRATTGADGEARFESVGVGAWVVVPDRHPAGDTTRSETTRRTPAVSGRFQVDPETSLLTVPFVAPASHSIHGKLVAPEGVPAPSWSSTCHVFASSEGRVCDVECRPRDDGSFVLEPLIEGTYSIRASAHYGLQLGAVEVEGIRAGTTELELRFPRVFEVALRILDAGSGRSTSGEVTVLGIDGKRELTTDVYGEAESDPSEGDNILEMRPGTYTLVAHAEDGAFGIVRGFEVRAQSTVQSLDIEVPPPALVHLTREASTSGTLPYVDYKVTCESFVVARGSFATPRSRPIPIPPMTSNLKLWIEALDTGTEHTQRYREASRNLSLTAGATHELDLERDFEWVRFE